MKPTIICNHCTKKISISLNLTRLVLITNITEQHNENDTYL